MKYVSVCALSQDGLVRDHNEDSLVVGAWTLCASVTLTPQTMVFPLVRPLVVAVADGLGGHPFGELASTIVVQELARAGTSLHDEQAVRDAVDTCNRAVFDEAASDPRRAGMGSTLAGVVVREDGVLVFNVGDSRVYSLSGEALAVVSVDDSPELAPGQTHTAIVTQTLGGGFDYTPVKTHVRTLAADPGTRLMVCSDGLSDVVPPEEIARLLGEPDAARATFDLWKAAIDGGGPDNITLAVLDVHDGGDATDEAATHEAAAAQDAALAAAQD